MVLEIPRMIWVMELSILIKLAYKVWLHFMRLNSEIADRYYVNEGRKNKLNNVIMT